MLSQAKERRIGSPVGAEIDRNTANTLDVPALGSSVSSAKLDTLVPP